MILQEIKLTRDNEENSVYFPYASQDQKLYLGKRNKIGGKPDWLQSDETPKCHYCHKEMTFYGQLDSVSDEIMINDSGIIYIFFCFDCGSVHAIAQSC